MKDIVEKYPLIFLIIACIITSIIIYLYTNEPINNIALIILTLIISFIWSLIMKQIFKDVRDYKHQFKIFTPRYPSLHTAVAYGGSLSTFYVLGINNYWSWIVLILAIISSLSRIIYKHHYTYEVIAGSIIGGGSCLIISLIFI